MKTACLTFIASLMILIMAALITACGTTGDAVSTEKPLDDPIIFEQRINESEGYFYLSAGDKVYVPYCPYEKEFLGDHIGYYEISSDEDRVDVYEFKGYLADEWIVDYDSIINEGMVYREINAKNVPDGLSSEYRWNMIEEETATE